MTNEVARTILTAEQIKRVRDAIAECDRYIAKEEPRAADLRPHEIAELLEFYRAHRAKLLAMLAGQGN